MTFLMDVFEVKVVYTTLERAIRVCVVLCGIHAIAYGVSKIDIQSKFLSGITRFLREIFYFMLD